MRKPLALLSLIALAACGAPSGDGAEDSALADSAAHSPNISVSAAPGVAFNYRYAFRLPSARIAAVQEQHAQTCERLGLARCRITGARYRVTGAQEIDAMLAFRLDPAIARQFGKTGVEAVGRAEGMLVDAEITGAEVAAAPATERRALLATTSMVFNYGSGELIPGFDGHSPIRAALRQAAENFLGGVSTLIVLLVTIAPWAGLALFGWWAWLQARRRFGHLFAPASAESA